MSNVFYDAAIQYSERGIAVFPLIQKDKKPATKNGCKDASMDPAQIKAWWSKNANYNIGIATGNATKLATDDTKTITKSVTENTRNSSSGIIVIDLDIDESKNIDGCKSFSEWQRINGELPKTWTARTGRGGLHLYFKTDAEYKNRAGILPGVDIRASGGYVVAPPSIHPNGNQYSWIVGYSPSDIPIADVDETVKNFLAIGTSSTMDSSRTADSDVRVKPTKVIQGQRNDQMFKLACSLIVKGLTDEAIYAACSAENQKSFEPPLSDNELKTIINSATSRYQKGTAPYQDSSFDNKQFEAMPASSFGDFKVDYIWYPFLPIGEYTVLLASGGVGKTILCCGIAASITRGEMLPGDTTIHDPANILIISAEDRGELLKERLLDSGADLDRAFIVDCIDSEGLNFTSRINELQKLIQKTNSKFVIIDPWHAFVGAEVDVNRINSVRPIFQRVASLAKKCDCAIVLLSHVNKRTQADNYNNAAIGSGDLINASRSAITVMFSPENDAEDDRVIVHTKVNYSKFGKSVKYRITKHGGVEWNGFSDITRQSLEEAARRKTTVDNVIKKKQNSSQLLDAIIELAEHNKDRISTKPMNVSYDELKSLYGDSVFSGTQPKRELDNIVDEALNNYNISLITGKQVNYKGKARNGFSIMYIHPNEQQFIELNEADDDNPFI